MKFIEIFYVFFLLPDSMRFEKSYSLAFQHAFHYTETIAWSLLISGYLDCLKKHWN